MLQKLEALREVPFFSRLAPPTLKAVLDSCSERTFLKGESLFHEGDPPAGLFVVWRGTVKIYKLGDSGREQILEIEGPGRPIAELPVFDGLPYPASCAAIEDSVLLHIGTSDFQRLLDGHPEITRAVIASLSQRLRRMVALVEEISLKAVRQRLAGLLQELAGGEDELELAWTHAEIAARIGTVREIVSRTLARMAQEGAIKVDGRTVRILDRSRL